MGNIIKHNLNEHTKGFFWVSETSIVIKNKNKKFKLKQFQLWNSNYILT